MSVSSSTKKIKPSQQTKDKFEFNRKQIVQQFLCRGLDAENANSQTDTLVKHAKQDLHVWNDIFWKDWILHSHAIGSASVANNALRNAKKIKK